MPTYGVNFENHPSTAQALTIALYQGGNDSLADVVSWQQITVASGGQATISWDPEHDVVLAQVLTRGNVVIYERGQVLPTEPGNAWRVVEMDGVRTLKPNPGGITPPDEIGILNLSSRTVTTGVGMFYSGTAYVRDLSPNTQAQFRVEPPRYRAALFGDDGILPGQVLSTAESLTQPVDVDFPFGVTTIALLAWAEDGVLYFGRRA